MLAGRNTWQFVILVALPAGYGAAAQVAPYESPPEDLPRLLKPQPVPFSHELHSRHRISCADCHPGATSKERAGLPNRDECMLCHQTIAVDRPAVRALAELPAGSRIRWVRAYRVPDFVFFNHSEHAKAEVDCVSCHGPVATRPVLSQEVSTNMVACMNCHAERRASNECYLCHDLGQ